VSVGSDTGIELDAAEPKTPAPAGVWHAVVLHWGRVEDTARCLASLAGVGFARVLLVDNGTAAPDLDEIARRGAGVELLRNAENRGYGAGNNVGLRAACAAGAEFVAVLNNDVAVEYPAMLADAERTFRAAASLGALSPPVFVRRGGWAEQAVESRFHRVLLARAVAGGGGRTPAAPPGAEATPTFAGSCWMAPVPVISRVGLLREDLFLYHEELDYGVRLRRAGFSCGRFGRGRGRVLHAGGTAAGMTPRQAYYCARNLPLLADGFSSPSRRRLLPAAALAALWLAARCAGVGRVGSAGAALRGLADGLRGRRGERSVGGA